MTNAQSAIMNRLKHVRNCRDRYPHRAMVYDAQERLLVTLLRQYRGRYREGLENQILRILCRIPRGQERLRQIAGLWEQKLWDLPEEDLAAYIQSLGGTHQLKDILGAIVSEPQSRNKAEPGFNDLAWTQTRAQALLALDLSQHLE